MGAEEGTPQPVQVVAEVVGTISEGAVLKVRMPEPPDQPFSEALHGVLVGLAGHDKFTVLMLPTDGDLEVLDDATVAELRRQIDARLHPEDT